MNEKFDMFEDLSYEKFKKMAVDDKLDPIEKVGFPIDYRENKEAFIFEDVISKLNINHKENKIILDIGCGCSNLTLMLIEYCKKNGHMLILIDSREMLDNLPDYDFIKKIEGYYPIECRNFIEEYKQKIDCIIAYSVIQYVFNELSVFNFIDISNSLLKESGRMLLGDIPNTSKRKRFFSSNLGISFHKNFTGKNEIPQVKFNEIEFNNLDDSAIMAIIQRARLSGFDAYLLPQDERLPMANRREDILIIRP